MSIIFLLTFKVFKQIMSCFYLCKNVHLNEMYFAAVVMLKLQNPREYFSWQKVGSPSRIAHEIIGGKLENYFSLKGKQCFLLPWPWISKSQAVLGGARWQRRPEVVQAGSPPELH